MSIHWMEMKKFAKQIIIIKCSLHKVIEYSHCIFINGPRYVVGKLRGHN